MCASSTVKRFFFSDTHMATKNATDSKKIIKEVLAKARTSTSITLLRRVWCSSSFRCSTDAARAAPCGR